MERKYELTETAMGGTDPSGRRTVTAKKSDGSVFSYAYQEDEKSHEPTLSKLSNDSPEPEPDNLVKPGTTEQGSPSDG